MGEFLLKFYLFEARDFANNFETKKMDQFKIPPRELGFVKLEKFTLNLEGAYFLGNRPIYVQENCKIL